MPTSIQPSPVPDLQQQYKIVQQASQQQQRQENRQGYKFQVPNTPNIKFTSHQVPHAQMIHNYSTLSHFSSTSASHAVSFLSVFSLSFQLFFPFISFFPNSFIFLSFRIKLLSTELTVFFNS